MTMATEIADKGNVTQKHHCKQKSGISTTLIDPLLPLLTRHDAFCDRIPPIKGPKAYPQLMTPPIIPWYFPL